MTAHLTPDMMRQYQLQAYGHLVHNDAAMLCMGLGLGKLQPNSEPVLTPAGWAPMGTIKPGDQVIGADGTPTKVLAVYPNGVVPVVKITFNDGSFTRCGWDHLWTVKTDKDSCRGRGWRTMTTRELVERGLHWRNVARWRVPLVAPVQYAAQSLPADPYTVGVYLGDGSCGTICTDSEILRNIGAHGVRPHATADYVGYGRVTGLSKVLRELGLLSLRSWEKFIPESYLRGSIDQRLGMLQGLLDTDGHPMMDGGIEFCSTSEQLVDGVIDLVQSLGGIARNKTPRVTRHQGGDGLPSWRVNIKMAHGLQPFRLVRKLEKWVEPTKYPAIRKIVSVEEDGSEESQCIRVAAADCLYVTRNHIVTHNTPTTLTTFEYRRQKGDVTKMLVFGPLRVIQAVWAREARKWTHLQHLRFSVVHGTKEKRLRALFANADVYLCNYENMNWLAEVLDHYYLSQGKPLPFQMVVYDEITKVKNSTSMRVAGGRRDRKDRLGNTHAIKVTGWRKILPHFQYRVGLTGTPASNGYLDLHGQYLVLDGGKRLGEYVTHYKDSYFESGYNGWGCTPTELGKRVIEQKISDITLKMDTRDYLDLPPVNYSNIMVELPDKARKIYDQVEATLFARLDQGKEIELFNKTSISNKCLQIANGSPYVNEVGSGEWSALHDAKLDALDEIIEEANGSPVLVGYNFRPDAERIMQKFKGLKPVNLTETPSKQTESVIDRWNAGKIRMIVGHPSSMAHGVDGLQDSGHTLAWFGLPWSLELYDQMNGRLDRSGQSQPVSIARILCSDSVDLAVADALMRKADDQEGFKDALDRYRRGQITNELEYSFL